MTAAVAPVGRLTWMPSYAIGAAELDADHRKLLDLINGFEDALDRGCDLHAARGLLRDIIEHEAAHIVREEAILRRQRYAHIEAHENEHRTIKSDLAVLAARLEDATKIEEAKRAVDILKDWFLRHVLVTDMHIKAFFEAKGL